MLNGTGESAGHGETGMLELEMKLDGTGESAGHGEPGMLELEKKLDETGESAGHGETGMLNATGESAGHGESGVLELVMKVDGTGGSICHEKQGDLKRLQNLEKTDGSMCQVQKEIKNKLDPNTIIIRTEDQDQQELKEKTDPNDEPFGSDNQQQKDEEEFENFLLNIAEYQDQLKLENETNTKARSAEGEEDDERSTDVVSDTACWNWLLEPEDEQEELMFEYNSNPSVRPKLYEEEEKANNHYSPWSLPSINGFHPNFSTKLPTNEKFYKLLAKAVNDHEVEQGLKKNTKDEEFEVFLRNYEQTLNNHKKPIAVPGNSKHQIQQSELWADQVEEEEELEKVFKNEKITTKKKSLEERVSYLENEVTLLKDTITNITKSDNQRKFKAKADKKPIKINWERNKINAERKNQRSGAEEESTVPGNKRQGKNNLLTINEFFRKEKAMNQRCKQEERNFQVKQCIICKLAAKNNYPVQSGKHRIRGKKLNLDTCPQIRSKSMKTKAKLLKLWKFCPICLDEIKDDAIHNITCHPKEDLGAAKLKCKAEDCNKYFSFCEEHWKINWNKLKRRQRKLLDEEIVICINQ